MKNLLFGLVALCFMSFNTISDVESAEAVIDKTPAIENAEEEFVPCLVRDCVIIDGVKYCTEWREADCIIVIVIE